MANRSLPIDLEHQARHLHSIETFVDGSRDAADAIALAMSGFSAALYSCF
jgi:hypothetical protein